MRKLVFLELALALLARSDLQAGPIEDLKPGEWLEVQNSHLEDVKADPEQFPWVAWGEGISGIINDWCSGAFDTKRDRLYIGPCGGHSGYFGNEVYAFDLNDLKWHRLTDPNPIVSVECPDASKYPCAIHTYDGLEYIPPPVDRLVQVGGWDADNTYALDLDKLVWEVNSPAKQGRTGDVAAWDPGTGLLWIQFNGYAGSGRLFTWDPVKDVWNGRSDRVIFEYCKTATVDYTRRKMVAVGNCHPGRVLTWTLAPTGGDIYPEVIQTTGSTEITDSSNPGLEYDPVSDRIIAWNGGRNVFSFDLDTNVWTKHTGRGADPGPPASNGTYGRFRYSPSKNVFVLVNDVRKNVFIYKHTDTLPRYHGGLPPTDLRIRKGPREPKSSSPLVVNTLAGKILKQRGVP